ncbi:MULTISPECIES: 5-formyltetrahydrofolate cyclo-ligase [Halorubrum]|uniref:5-formyltetrahydrofolate cyclo-ligase n=1 Tax=Halorubrum hochstenium ATCC 700873 TaxID=1227481 RepID=M0FQJ4_9EURY|nr:MULTISPECIES: 5-formyltetrahydrofolate cyclo-ligase [Halorubrum]ELZ61517.1 5-formyltetrahydrofolate cyclo-ligase [Halorubrum hochstenium ATCC 700873]
MDKQAVREAVWDAFDEGDQGRFPFPPHDRIPNFAGADAAAERLAATAAWESAATLKANPDAPQLPVRRAALRAGKTVYVAQPRLRDPDPFLRLDPTEIPPDEIDDATTVSGVSEYGTSTAPEDLPHVDLIVAGSVGVTTDGARIGKGEGYSDLEWAVLRELDAVDTDTTVATTVHELSVLDGPESAAGADADLPGPDAHDVPLDLVVTPERTVRTDTPYARPSGVDWDALGGERLDAIPVLRERAPGSE